MKSSNSKLSQYEIVNDFFLLNWDDGTESMIEIKQMRDQCPCANCAGEKDALGNLYIGPEQKKSEASYLIKKIDPVGHYALRPYWGDGHNTGLFSFDLLKKLSTS
ncbi:MAG: DUF971 domain-containing protein [Candidatus Marinimicrobia bacterium]|jgi:DUF971 family protein|nr:DUF971 domain-containing protein [Candidatus Neomarinimicrobiota bacterium]MBT3496250.1 DUF971 domain-containing protein [Candidatus Neomarinimicrobiota bacterium]MBT3692783.1 DUF971 domain-containing protein [Candidatus Neomarinimicrobiota bacterium]MBT3731852.1 DUF971 domain-containing protein [Candidatus Neomarinimicrobiota bacterium]MBT4143712.1 DUF971 domain-containing protein [Candidatus Neomarinimicrobiota bacterium]